MENRSTIQRILESNAVKEEFRASLESIFEKYIIEDAVFSNRANNLSGTFRQELVNGYFVADSSYNSLKEAIEASGNDIVIHVINNEKFETGKFYEKLSDCPHDRQILDIQTLHVVNQQ